MADLVDVIEDYSPPNEQTGVSLLTTIQIDFDRLMDEDSVERAFFVEGPDTDSVFGPNSKGGVWPSALGESLGQEDDFLESPGYKGIVQGTAAFTTASSKTTLTFTPSQALAASTNYVVHLTDCYSLSVGETEAGVGNLGNGELEFEGTWDGADDTVNARITTSGVAGIAEFVWWKGSDPLTVKGPILSTRRRRVILQDDLYINFGDGSFYEDDEFSADLSTGTLCEGHVTFEFDTGSGSIESLPSTASSSILSALRQTGATSATPLSVVSVTPTNHSAQVDIDTSEIVIKFNKTLDASSISASSVSVVTSVATGHPVVGAIAHGSLAKTISVSGRYLTISI